MQGRRGPPPPPRAAVSGAPCAGCRAANAEPSVQRRGEQRRRCGSDSPAVIVMAPVTNVKDAYSRPSPGPGSADQAAMMLMGQPQPGNGETGTQALDGVMGQRQLWFRQVGTVGPYPSTNHHRRTLPISNASSTKAITELERRVKAPDRAAVATDPTVAWRASRTSPRTKPRAVKKTPRHRKEGYGRKVHGTHPPGGKCRGQLSGLRQ